MAIDPRIPLSVTPPEWNPLAFQEELDRSRTSKLQQESMGVTNALQKTAYADQMIARAADQGKDDPAAWDANFSQLAQANVPGAAELVGKWSPATVQQVLGRGQMTTQGYLQQQANAQAAPQRGSAGAQGGQPLQGSPDPFGGKPNEEVARNLVGVQMLLNPIAGGAVRNKKDLDTLVDAVVAAGHPEAAKVKGMFADGPLFIQQMNGYAEKLKSAVRMAQERLGANGVDAAPEPKPTYGVTMSEAGPIISTTPPDGSEPSFKFGKLEGQANPAFLPPPKAAVGGASATDLQAEIAAMSPDELRTFQYAADRYRASNVMPPMGQGVAGTHARQLILYLAAQAAEQSGGTGRSDVAGAYGTKSDASSLTNLTKQADAIGAYEDLMLANIENLKKQMPAGVGTAMPFINNWVQTGRAAIGDEDVPPYVASLITVLNEYGKIMSGATGAAGLTDSARAEAAHMLNGVQTSGQVLSVINKTIIPDAANRKRTMAAKINEIRARMRSGEDWGDTTGATTGKKPAWVRSK